MSADAALALLFIAILALTLGAGRRVPETLPPPQIVYVQAPQSSGVAWLSFIIVVYLVLRFLGLV